jgi:hypothetical protein
LRQTADPCDKKVYSNSREAVSVAKLLISLAVSIWVSVCAASPEFIWQGLQELLHHFSRQTAYSIILIGLILTVFVEPILERAREGRWQLKHPSTRNLLFTMPIAFIFGVAAVGLHESMIAYLAPPHSDPGVQQEGMIRAVSLILEWACIPLAVTMAWFSARTNGWLRYLAGGAAAVWVVGAGWYYDWPVREIFVTSIPCVALIPLGQTYVARRWDENTFRNLAVGLSALSVLWLAITLLVQAALPAMGIAGGFLYESGDVSEYLRFYLGWALGLALAPNPVRTTVDERV